MFGSFEKGLDRVRTMLTPSKKKNNFDQPRTMKVSLLNLFFIDFKIVFFLKILHRLNKNIFTNNVFLIFFKFKFLTQNDFYFKMFNFFLYFKIVK